MSSQTFTTPTTALDPPRPARPRRWVPALLTAVFVTGGLWLLQLLSGRPPFSDLASRLEGGSDDLLVILIGPRVRYFGVDNDLLFSDDAMRTGVMTAAVFVVSFLVVWVATIGVRPRAFFPVFFLSWLGAVLGAVGGGIAAGVEGAVRYDMAVGLVGAAVDASAGYGVVYGWIPALLVALIWVAVPPRRDPEPEPLFPDEPTPSRDVTVRGTDERSTDEETTTAFPVSPSSEYPRDV